jgi:hypothetical protein
MPAKRSRGTVENAARIAGEEMPLILHSSSAKERRMDSIETFSKGCIALTGADSGEFSQEGRRLTLEL